MFREKQTVENILKLIENTFKINNINICRICVICMDNYSTMRKVGLLAEKNNKTAIVLLFEGCNTIAYYFAK